jgi:branched-chain amino acid transport system ATP-binding protein
MIEKNQKKGPVLTVRDLSISFGGLAAVSSLSFDVQHGEIFSIIGPNGAGKTTVFNLISGFYRPDQGSIVFMGRETSRMAPDGIANLGLGRTFQNLELFSNMTVLENLLVAHHSLTRSSFLGEVLRTRRTTREEERIRESSMAILNYLGLEQTAGSAISGFPFPVQKRIELARALAVKPKLLLLDEPAAGLNAVETNELSALVDRVRRDHELSVLLVEHDMSMVMKISDRICVLDYGKRIAEGSVEEIQRDTRVKEAYLGSEVDLRA